MKSLEICYPNFGKKAITFSIDDGNLKYDRPFIDIVRPHGIKGTFNLSHVNYETLSNEELVELYRGFEIANHCKQHPYAFSDDVTYTISEDAFDAATADESLVYRDPKQEGMYLIHRPRGWRKITDSAKYIELIDEAKAELESVFGKGTITGFAWPFGEQRSRAIVEHLASQGYMNVRKTAYTRDTTAFDIPTDLMAWRCNANQDNLLEIAALFREYPDDGRLKMFAFGVHSADFESSGRWDDLRRFSEEYGNCPDKFWYATVGEILGYGLAAARLTVSNGIAVNESDRTLYILVDGEGCSIAPGESVEL